MNKKDKTIGLLLSIASGLVSATFVVYGGGVLFQENVPFWIVAFASITSIYGISAIIVLFWAWRGGGIKSAHTMKIIAIVYFVLFFLGSLDVGMISGQEVLGIIIVASATWLNWLVVNKVGQWRISNAQTQIQHGR